MRRETFFDLELATIGPGEDPPPEAHWVRIEEPSPGEVEARIREGWFYKPVYVTYAIPAPPSLDAYIEGAFRTGTRNKPRRLLKRVPERYRLEVDEGAARAAEFHGLYRRTVVAKPRGRDRLAEYETGFGPGWTGFYLRAAGGMVAGVLVHEEGGHLSVGYGGFDPAHRALDLEHFLIMKVIERAAERGAGIVSLGMDTNRYGHHLPLGLPAYKLRLGFVPLPFEGAGRELVKVQHFDVFDDGLFFYGYGARGLVGHLFTREEPDLRPFRHHVAPPVRTWPIP